MSARISTPRLLAYGALALPLTMAALPIYVHVPKFYAHSLGLNLASVGVLLLLARILDAVQDPLLGYWSDMTRNRRGGRMLFIGLGSPLLAVGMLGLFNPPPLSPYGLSWWLIANLLVVYTAYSMVTISYQAYGAELSTDVNERTRITSWREGIGLIGVFLAALLPEVLSHSAGPRQGFAYFSYLFAPTILLLAAVTIVLSPRPAVSVQSGGGKIFSTLYKPLRNPLFRPLLGIFVLNGIAASIPATLVLFFIQDVVARPDLTAQFLVAYFAAGAIGMPGWVWLSSRVGKARAWFAGMIVSIVAFIWAFLLGPGDATAYFVICILSGLGLGSDLALPPSLLADVIDEDERTGKGRNEGAYFGLWNLVTKANLALAAGIALPLLGALGYAPNTAHTPEVLRSVAVVYALLPCVLKACAAMALVMSPFFAPPGPTKEIAT